MKARFFEIDTSHLPASTPDSPISQTLSVPGLSAYAIDHADLQYNGISNAVGGAALAFNGDSIVSLASQFQQSDQLRLALYYYGIRDYSLLFPAVRVVEPDRALRIGKFYEEAEKAFDSGAWLSFMLMCGAIFENLLYFKATNPNVSTLYELADTALNQSLIDQQQHAIINTIRKARNVIHCDKMQNSYVTRAVAMDVRGVVENLMLRL